MGIRSLGCDIMRNLLMLERRGKWMCHDGGFGHEEEGQE